MDGSGPTAHDVRMTWAGEQGADGGDRRRSRPGWAAWLPLGHHALVASAIGLTLAVMLEAMLVLPRL
jgi:hypothetical protein